DDAAGLAVLRHDVRTPLNQVLGYCDLWLEGGEDDAAAAERFRPQLEQLRSAGLCLLTRLDALRDARPCAPAPAGRAGSGELPAWPPPEVALAPAAVPGHLLVVDDNAFNREVLLRRLQRQGHRVTEAANGRQALELLRDRPFDVILLDILMPEMN